LLPWVKFLWESYCQCLELLRVNTHCENLYHDIARMAFGFCLKYNRKSEFRRLCDKLRKHLEDICKISTQSTGVSITKLETQQLNLDTRLYQLDSAIQMELWQEAYKAIEDIHGLMTLSKKTPVSKTMANYYQKLAMVFWKAGNQLFHAAALLKLFQLTREMKKNITKDELQRMASHVLIATLSIPLPSAHPEFDRFIETDKSPLEKAQKLAVLLGLTQPPTRVSLLKDVVRLNVTQLAAEQFTNLYTWLEIDFDPLNLCKRVQAVIDFIETDDNSLLKQYTQSLKDVTLMRLIRQVSQVYQSIEFVRLVELGHFSDIFYLERILVDCVRHNDMQIRIDHQKRCVHFGTDLTESQREDHSDGPTLQSMPSEQIRSQLVNMSVVLHRAIAAIYPDRKKAEREKLRTQMVEHYHDIKDREHQRILQRQKIIEDRKEFIERMNIAREEEELRRQEEAQKLQAQAEKIRLEQEIEERERIRHKNEIQAIKEKSLKEKMQQISQTSHGKKMLMKLDEEGLKKLDAEQIAAKETEELIKERKEHQSKLKSQEKKVDYFERAKRLDEIPLIEKFLSEKQVQDKEFWEKREANRIEKAIAERKIHVAQKERLSRMLEDKDIFISRLRQERASLFVEKVKKFDQMLEEERKKRLAQRIVQRREDRRKKWLQEKEDEKKRQEEEIRKAKEEEERIELEKRRKEREVEEERKRISFEKQRQKDLEIEKKLQEERDRFRLESKEEEKPARDVWRSERGPPAGREPPAVVEKDAGGWRSVGRTVPAATENREENRERRGEERDTAQRDKGSSDSSWRKRGDGPARPTPAAPSAPPSRDEKPWRRDDRTIRREDDRPPRREDDRPPRRDDDRPPRRDDDRPARRDDDRPPRRDDERLPRREDDRPPRRDDDRPQRRDDDRQQRRDDDRGGRRDDGPRDFRSGKDDREFRRDDRGPRRDAPRENRNDRENRGGAPAGGDSGNWRRADRTDDRENRRPAGGDRGGDRRGGQRDQRDQGNQGNKDQGGSWRSETRQRNERDDDRKERNPARTEKADNRDRDDGGEWTNVKRR